MTICVISGLTLLIVAVNTIDNLLYPAFILLAFNTWFGGLLTVQLGLYFQGRTRRRVIFILNALFDAGAITFLGLWSINKSLQNLTVLFLVYLAAACLVYGSAIVLWRVAAPEKALPETTEAKVKQESDDDTSVNRASATAILAISAASPSGEVEHEALSNIELDDVERPEPSPTSQLTESILHLNPACPVQDGVNRIDEGSERKLSPGKPANEAVETELVPKPATKVAQTTDLSIMLPTPIHAEIRGKPYILYAQRSRRQQLTSGPYFLLLAFFAIHLCANQWTLSTARDFLAYLGDDQLGNRYLTIFTLLTPASILAVPFADVVVHYFGYHGGLQCTNILALIYSLVKVTTDSLQVQVVGFVAFSFFRSFLFGITFSFLPALLSHNVAGTAAGFMYCSAAVLSSINIVLSKIAVEQLHGNFLLPNLIYTCMILPCILAAFGLGQAMKRESECKNLSKQAKLQALDDDAPLGEESNST